MSPPGFIHDELDVKMLVLYIMSHVAAPIDFFKLIDLALCDDGVDYFLLTKAIAHLVETENLLLTDDQYYSITEKGRRNSQVCETSLPFPYGTSATRISPRSTPSFGGTPKYAESICCVLTEPMLHGWPWMTKPETCLPWSSWPHQRNRP